VVWLCKIAEISRAGYYKWKKNIVLREKRADRDADLKAPILGIHRLRPYFGYKRMRTVLGKEGLVVNHKRYAAYQTYWRLHDFKSGGVNAIFLVKDQ